MRPLPAILDYARRCPAGEPIPVSREEFEELRRYLRTVTGKTAVEVVFEGKKVEVLR